MKTINQLSKRQRINLKKKLKQHLLSMKNIAKSKEEYTKSLLDVITNYLTKRDIQVPTYTYQCMDCEEIYDYFHGINDIHKECNKCKSNNITKVIITPPPFHLHGEGWYKTDHNRIRRAKNYVDKESNESSAK